MDTKGRTIIRNFLQQDHGRGARSTVLHPLQWSLGLTAGALVIGAGTGAPAWVLVVLAGLLGLFAVGMMVAFFYFAKKDPQALRSERYSLSRLAIERGLVGDDLMGLVADTDNDDEEDKKMLPPAEGGSK